jgi:hypothetical protein
MPFTDEESRRWHEQKRARERAAEPPRWRPHPAAVCIHCHNPFGCGEGHISGEAQLCDLCLGDN